MIKGRDGKVEILRFFAGLAIALYHFEWIYIGHPVLFEHFYIWVEFFFIISGFFMVLHQANRGGGYNCDADSYKYVFSRIKKVYLLYLLGFVFSFIVTNITSSVPVKQWMILLWKAKWEILLCTQCGFDNNIIYNGGGAASQLSVLFICSLIIYTLLAKYKTIYINIIAPIVIIGGLGRIINIYGNLSQWLAFDVFFTVGILRGFIDMSVGVLAAEIFYPWVKNAGRSWVIRVGIFIPSIFILLLVIGRNQISFNDLILYIFLFAWLVVSIYSSSIQISDRINDIVVYLGKLSYPIFLFHYGIIVLLKTYLPNLNYFLAVSTFSCMLLLAGVLMLCIEKGTKQLFCSKKSYI